MSVDDSLKVQGDRAFHSHDYSAAIHCYTQALECDPSSAVLYSNRSAAYASVQKYAEALADAERCIKLKPEWAKGYTRKGLALFYMGSVEEAEECYSQGLAVEPENAQIRESLAQLRSLLDQHQHPFAALLKDSNIVRLMTHSRTSGFFQSQEFHDMINDIRANPSSVSKYIKDSRLLEVVSVLLGTSENGQEPSADPRTKAAEAEKELGNVAYKQKKFGEALSHYESAHELDPNNVTYVNNMSAVYFEKKDYAKCVEKCEEALALGREAGSSSRQITRALTRQGDALLKLGQIDAGIQAFNQSLLENRDEAVVQKLASATKLKEQSQGQQSAEELNAEGNKLFAQRKYRKAKELYTNALALNSEEARFWMNRSACNLKLRDFEEALSDVQKCLELEPRNPKALFRKAVILAQSGQNDEVERIMQEIEVIEGPEAEDMRAQLEKVKRTVSKRHSHPSEP